MARFAVIDPATKLVVNAIEAGPGFTLDGFTLVASDTAGIGDAYDPKTKTFTAAPAPPEAVPTEISPRQLLIGLAAKGWITPAEALAAATAGTPPAVIEGVFTSLPADRQLAARITWARMTTVLRTDALVPLLAATKGQSEADVDEFFRTYAKV